MHPIPIDEREAWLDERQEWLATLPPSPVPDFLTGLKPRSPDPRDFNLADHLPEAMPEAAPSGDLMSIIRGPAINQQSIPSCVSHTAAMGQALFQQSEEGVWRTFDAPRIHEATGEIMRGRYATDILKYGVTQGFPLVGSDIRYKIAAYAFVQPGSAWVETIIAWLSLGRPVWICFLIPSSFGGAESGGNITSGYHEALICGWRPGAFLIRNSWGDNWGIRIGGYGGFTWMPTEYLQRENYHRGLVLAHTPIDERSGPPPPSPVAEIKNLLDARGQSIREADLGAKVTVVGAGFDTLDIPFTVWLGETPTTIALIADDRITVMVSGPKGASGPITVRRSEQVVARSPFTVKVLGSDPPPPPPPSDIIITAKATGAGAASIVVGQSLTIGNVSAALLVTRVDKGADPPPPPPPPPLGELTVVAQVAGSGLYVKAKAGARYISVAVSAESPTVTIQGWHTRSNAEPDGSQASWATFRLSGRGEITVTARADDGRTGTTTLMV